MSPPLLFELRPSHGVPPSGGVAFDRLKPELHAKAFDRSWPQLMSEIRSRVGVVKRVAVQPQPLDRRVGRGTVPVFCGARGLSAEARSAKEEATRPTSRTL